MAKGNSRTEISDAILNGIEKAASTWADMSDAWLWVAPEHYVSSVIAQTLHKQLDKTFVCLEWSTQLTIQDARGQPKRGRPHMRTSGTKRFDIVTFYCSGDRKPRAAIEVKHRITASLDRALGGDFERLAIAVSETSSGSSLSYACLALYIEVGDPIRKYKSLEERVERRQKEIFDWAKSRVRSSPKWNGLIKVDCKIGKTKIGKEQEGAYCAMVLELTCPKKRIAPVADR